MRAFPPQVFHGAESDILWLQQDFDIYVVGLFDTYHATKVLRKHVISILYQIITLTVLSILIRQTTLSTLSHRYWPSSATSPPTSDTKWPTGEFDLFRPRCCTMRDRIHISFYTYTISCGTVCSNVHRESRISFAKCSIGRKVPLSSSTLGSIMMLRRALG